MMMIATDADAKRTDDTRTSVKIDPVSLALRKVVCAAMFSYVSYYYVIVPDLLAAAYTFRFIYRVSRGHTKIVSILSKCHHL